MFDRIRDDIKSIIKRDPAARNTLEVITCYPGFHAVMLHRASHWCWNHRLKWAGRFISHVSRMLTGIEIHPGAVVGRRVFIDHGVGVVIGETAEVGDDCTIYQGVTLGGTSLAKGRKRHPTLGKGVIVGAGAKVLGTFTVGDGAKVGSNAVLMKAVPAGGTAVGNPARIIEKKKPKEDEDPSAVVFSSYGITPDADDPLLKVLRCLITNAAAQEHRIKTLTKALEAANIPYEDSDEDTVNMEYLKKILKKQGIL